MSQLLSLLEETAKAGTDLKDKKPKDWSKQDGTLSEMEFHWDKLMQPIFIVIGIIIFLISIDLWCCMSNNKKPFVPYYLEPTNKEKSIAIKKLEEKQIEVKLGKMKKS